MAILTAEQIRKAHDRKRELVSVPEWGGEVWVAKIGAFQKDYFDEWNVKRDESHVGVKANIVAAACVNEDWSPLFTPEDVAMLGQKDFEPIDRICEVALRLNNLGQRQHEELEKNSEAASADSSPSS